MFKNREEAGEKLAQKLKEKLSEEQLKKAVVMAIPRGGTIIGQKISHFLNLPLDCLITKKIPSPGNEELAIGAVGDGGAVVWENELVERMAVPLEYKQEIVKNKILELEKKKSDFCGSRPTPVLKDKVVIITDDGVATGATMKVAIAVAKSLLPKEIIVAVPVVSLDSLSDLKGLADQVIYLESPEMFFSVGQFYENFDQIPDEEVVRILKEG